MSFCRHDPNPDSTDKHVSDLKSGPCVLVVSVTSRRKTGEHNTRHDLPCLALPYLIYVVMYVLMCVVMYVFMYVLKYVIMYVLMYVLMYVVMYVLMYVLMYVVMYVLIYVLIDV